MFLTLFPSERKQGCSEKWLILGLGRKLSLEDLVVPGSKDLKLLKEKTVLLVIQ